MKLLFTSVFISFFIGMNYAQTDYPCSHDLMLERHLKLNPDALQELEQNEIFIQSFLEQSQ